MHSTTFDMLLDSSGEKKTMIKALVLSRWEMPDYMQKPITVRFLKKRMGCGGQVVYEAVEEIGGIIVDGLISRSV